MSNESAIEINGLGKMYKLYKNNSDKYKDAFKLNFFKKDYYKEFWALRDINISINKGERVGLIGHNGAGKSTLLKTIIGRISPTEGSVRVNGKIQALLELGTGFHPEFTGRENIKAALMLVGCSYKQIDEMMDGIIDFAELEEYIDQPVKTYSAGMYARLAFSTATAIKPELLIIDEVLGAGDAYFSGKCVERMRSLTMDSGATVLFVSHDLASVQAICDRVIWIDKGTVRYDGDTLTAIKLYSKSVRENEELRIKIRDLKISKKQAMLLDRDQDLYNVALFHFIPKDEAEFEGKVKIRRILLKKNGEVLAEINVGSPMDNDANGKNLILDDPEYMCWGKPQKDEAGYYRSYQKNSGRYKHAPFQLRFSKRYDSLEGMELVVTADTEKGNELLVECLNEKKGEYNFCGTILRYRKETTLILEDHFHQDDDANIVVEKKITNTVLENQLNKRSQREKLDYRYTDECIITGASIYSTQAEAKRVFTFEEPAKQFSFQIVFKEPKEHFIFCFIIFTIRGDYVFNCCEEVQLSGAAKDIKLDIDLGSLRIGPGDYTISFGIYSELNTKDNSVEAKALAIIDRAMGFKIEKPLNYSLNTGVVVPKLNYKIETDMGRGYACKSLL